MENIESARKREFKESLAELVELAAVSGNRLTKEQIHLYFKDIIGDDGQYSHIYEYLKGMEIEIEGEENSAAPKAEAVGSHETDEARAFYDMYIKELDELGSGITGDIGEDTSNKKELIGRVKSGDAEAVNLLTQLYLPMVVDIAGEYLSGPLGRSDLVAEGNLALLEANIEYNGDVDIERYEGYIGDRIRRGIEAASYEELGSSRISKHLLEQVNALNDASTELAEELGREATLEELSERLSLPEDKIKELMKVSIDALTVDEGE